MFVINSPRNQKEIIELLESQDGKFKLVEKEGIMKMVFETTMEDKEAAAKLAKETIKKQTWGKSIYFQIEVK
ncbi:MAG: hypothetical protein FWE07_06055 [Turicibacter sp.]|nr:hypothetical protein [Turicibacter sp.]